MKLTLHFSALDNEAIRYYLTQDAALIEQGEITLSSLPAILNGKSIESCLVAIPGEQVTCLSIQLPAGTQRHLSQAIPYLVEEQLAAPLESLHIAHAQPTQSRQCQVLVMDKGLMAEWHGIAGQLAFPVTDIVPEYLLLPVEEIPVCFRQNTKTLIRLPDGTGYCFTGEPPSLSNEPLSSDRGKQSAKAFDQTLFEQYLSSYDQTVSTNLLQGEFAIRPTTNRDWLKPTAWSLVVSILMFAVYLAGAGLFFQDKADLLETEARMRYQDLFPNDKRIVNIRRQMQGHLNNAQTDISGDDFFVLLSGLSNAVAEAGGNGISPRHLQYSQKDSTLSVELQAKDIPSAHQLRDNLSQRQLTASILSVNQQDNGIVARFEVTAP